MATQRSATSAIAAMLTSAESVQSRLELVLDEKVGPLSAEQLAFLQVAARDGKHVLDVLHEWRFILLVESGTLALDAALVDLVAVAQRAANGLVARALTAGKTIEVDAPASVWLCADEKRVELAVRRLLGHVFALAERGSPIRIRVSNEGFELRYEGTERPTGEELPVALAEAVAHLHGGTFSAAVCGEEVVLSLSLLEHAETAIAAA